MLYIICAFEAEARAIIDHYKLTKKQIKPFALFQSSEILLIVCGMGPDNAKTASQYLLNTFSLHKEDSCLNLGICAAKDDFSIGELLQVQDLQNQTSSYTLETLDSDIKTVSCYSSDKVLDSPSNTDIAEMEALSIYETVSSYFEQTNISILKIVSDNFRPFKPNKQFVIDLIRNNIKPIKEHINQLTGANHVQ
jgi:hypothetical protein